VHTHKHDGKNEKAGPEADIEQSEHDSRQNAASADRREEQQQPPKRRDSDNAAQAAVVITDTTPARLGPCVTQATPAPPHWR